MWPEHPPKPISMQSNRTVKEKVSGIETENDREPKRYMSLG